MVALALLPLSIMGAVRVCITPDSGLNMLSSGVVASDITSDDQVEGFDKDLRVEILTRRLGLAYTVRILGSYGELQVRTRAGECEIGWAPFYLTASRERCTPDPALCKDVTAAALTDLDGGVGSWEPYRCCTDSSMEYLPWTVAAMYAPAESQSNFFLSIFTLFTEPFLINFMCFLFIWIVIFAHLAWLAERNANAAQFPRSYIEGIDDGIWWAAVTFSTVGYGDKAPKTPAGRLIAMVWMFFGVSMIAILTGNMATRFQELSKADAVTGPADLLGRRVCGYPSTFKQPWREGVRMVEVEAASIIECGEMLRDGLVDVVVMDTPIMAYYRLTEEWCQDRVVKISSPFASPPVGLAFPEAGVAAAKGLVDYRNTINVELLDFFGTVNHKLMARKWFPETSEAGSSDSLQLSMVIPAFAVILLYVVVQLARMCKHRKHEKQSRNARPDQVVV